MLVVETMDSKLTGKYIFETDSIDKDRQYRLIYGLRIRFMFNFAASAMRNDLLPVVSLQLCLLLH